MNSVSSSSRVGFVFLFFIIGAFGLAPTAHARYSALVVDADTGEVLYEQNAYDFRHPASLTKMMTLYMVFDALRAGRLNLYQPLWVSDHAASRPPSKLGLRAGDTLTVQEAIYALVTCSANDAATVIAESLGGSEFQFSQRMTQKARQLGMTQTYFRNASGLPDPYQITTAWDMYRLGRALQIDFPQYYRFFSVTDFFFRNRIYRNHNRLLYDYNGTDGIKTGYIRDSGYNLVASVNRGGRRVIGVVFGGDTGAMRDTHMRAILDQSFAKIATGGSFAVVPPPVRMVRADVYESEVERPRAFKPPVRRATLVRNSRADKAAKYSRVAKSTRSGSRAKAVQLGRGSGKSARQVEVAKRGGSAKPLAKRGGSAKPLQLAKRGEPGKSTSRQIKPTKPEPAKAVKQTKVVKLTKPVESVKPVKAVKPVKPVKSAKPARQASAGRPLNVSRSRLLSKAD